ncbi:hypothetical protein ACNF49_40255 [Actinomadura sp. ATCC 39365]|uniref:hypothetical protein n=1 Tax=Nonomuraea sp. NPDC005692 TaxID=3157168 RepID=UPI0033F2C874
MNKKVVPAAMAGVALAALTVTPATAAATPVIEIRPGHSATVQESDHKFLCPTNEVLIGREHIGDENADTTYWCGRIYIDNEQVTTLRLSFLGSTEPENESFFVTQAHQALTGRSHDGDENGYTSYYTGALFWQGKVVKLVDRHWVTYPRESNHSTKAGALEVMTGRWHSGDENGQTGYEFATVTFSG